MKSKMRSQTNELVQGIGELENLGSGYAVIGQDCDEMGIPIFPAAQIDVVWFPEGAGGDRFDEKIFNLNHLDYLDSTLYSQL